VLAHGVLLVDKPSGPTSHDVVARARKALGTREVGHAGTLDPLATGVLVLGVREGCKALRYLALDDKRYHAFLQLGSETDTLDSEGKVVAQAPVPPGLQLEQVSRVAAQFLGEHEQAPPAFSAIKQDGVPHHVRARRGETVELTLRRVVLHGVEILAVNGAVLELGLHCGSGFYVRSFARDLARALGTVAHLTGLRRTQSGAYRSAEAVSHAELEAAAGGDQDARDRVNAAVVPLAAALAHVPALTLDDAGAAHARHGRLIPLGCVLGGAGAGLATGAEPLLLLSMERTPLALARQDREVLRVVRGLRLE
jgi:tRNA pseudouridine55 synthase